MALPSIQYSFAAGELSPSLYGRIDLPKWHVGASTMRNFFVNYRGGASSRAGTAYVGMCKQGAPNAGGTSTSNPPRDIRFQFNLTQGYALEFGDQYMRIKSAGAYVVESSKTIASITLASPGVFTVTGHGYSNGDWVYVTGAAGMTNFNGLTWIVQNVTTNTFTVTDLFGNAVNTSAYSAYTSGGLTERVYTLTTPWAAVDLPYLKYVQSADTMSLTCVNQATGTDYPPYDLVRNGATNWTLTQATFASSMSAPASCSATPQSSTTLNTYYAYCVTAVGSDGEESVASPVGQCQNNDISAYAGSNTITWSAVTGATSYNVFKASTVYNTAGSYTFPSGLLYGFVGTSTSTTFIDNNITADFTKVPPTHTNPFTGTGYYPGVVSYFQQRRVYANTKNNPDTYWMSQPGAYKNMDSATPTVDSDAIIGTPWGLQVNGIQSMVMMPSGLVVLTGNGAWQLSGANGGAFTPANQSAAPQAYNGISNIIQPIPVNYDILYVQAKGSIVRDLSYNFFVNIYTGTDMTILSNHFFSNYTIISWTYCEEPYKIIWTVRNDGTMLSFTYLKEQDVYGWARHDTNGQFIGVCSVTEPPVDALYCIVKRYVNGVWVYYSERMDNRIWPSAESCWCVDCGLTYSGTTPSATLTASGVTGTVTFTASASVFSSGNVGSVIRAGGGIGTITAYNSGTSVTATMTQAITATIPNDPNNTVAPVTAGNWSISVPTKTVSGLNHLNGMMVSILADGNVFPQQVVSNGSITLSQACSKITIGLPFTAQLQSLYLEPPGQPVTSQGRRKNIYAVTARLESSRGITIGSNQPDAATQPYGATVAWTNMVEQKQRGAAVNAGQSIPLFTGDVRIAIPPSWQTGGQVAVQQTYPLPCNVLGLVPEYTVGDTPSP